MGPRETRGNRKAIEKWHKRAVKLYEEKQNDKEEDMRRFDGENTEKGIHSPLLFGAHGNNNKKAHMKK